MKGFFRYIFKKEPVIALGGAAPAVFALAAYFGLGVSEDDVYKILTGVGILGTIIARSLVRPEASIPDHTKAALDAAKKK